MFKKIVLAVFGLVLIVGGLVGIKVLQIRTLIAAGGSYSEPPVTVTAAAATSDAWESLLTSVGSIVPVQGVTVSAELNGKVEKIAFESGASVKAGDLLAQLDVSSEKAQLRAAEAAVALAKVDLDRTASLLASKTTSQSDYDNVDAKYKEAVAQADAIRTAIEKKTIRAPFSGHLGIRQINLGQNLKEGDPIVSLQSLDPIYVNFLLPQQQLTQIAEGYTVRVTTDALPGETTEGKLTAISPEVDPTTRNVEMQATLANPHGRLRAGMFVNVAVVLPDRNPVIAIPATAVLYAPYSDSVFVIENAPPPPEKEKGVTVAAMGAKGGGVEEPKGPTSNAAGETPGGAGATGATGSAPQRIIRQQFVQLGESRGDFVAVKSGLKEGDTIVTTGVFKLRNGQSVVIDNTLSPTFEIHPAPEQE